MSVINLFKNLRIVKTRQILTMFKFRIRQDARIDYAALSDTSLEEKNMLDPISKSSMVKS